MFGDESIARECFKCINGLRYFSLWRVGGGKLGQVYKTFNLEKMVHATDIFTKTNRTNQNGKLFHPGMFDPASPQNSRDSIIVIVVLSARVPGQTLLIKLRIENIDLLIIILIMLNHLDDSLRNTSVGLLGWHKVCFITSLPLQNIIIITLIAI